MEATLGGNKRCQSSTHPDLSYLPTQSHRSHRARAPLADTHTDSSACFLASATCCSRSFSATWACRSISLKLWLLTFWAPKPFLAPSWEENYVMGTCQPRRPLFPPRHRNSSYTHKGSFLKFKSVKRENRASARAGYEVAHTTPAEASGPDNS